VPDFAPASNNIEPPLKFPAAAFCPTTLKANPFVLVEVNPEAKNQLLPKSDVATLLPKAIPLITNRSVEYVPFPICMSRFDATPLADCVHKELSLLSRAITVPSYLMYADTCKLPNESKIMRCKLFVRKRNDVLFVVPKTPKPQNPLSIICYGF
jgi:hypothetical protein